MSTTTTTKTRTITLTGRRPVKIRDDQWPLIAEATGDSGDDWTDGARHDEAYQRGELDRYGLRARRHADGRVLVYGILDGATAWTQTRDHRGGELLEQPSDAEIAEAIQRVGTECGLPDSIIRDAISDLPAEEL